MPNQFSKYKILILFVFFTSCKALVSSEKYQGFWLGEFQNNKIANHQIIEIENGKIYFYNLNEVVDSIRKIRKNRIIDNRLSIPARIKLIKETNSLQIISNNKEKSNINSFKKLEPTELTCNSEILKNIEDENAEWYIIITEKGKFYCTQKIHEIEDKSRYEFSQIRILKMASTYFIGNKDIYGKNRVTPIIKIRDDFFVLNDSYEGKDIKTIWGKP